LALHYPLNAFTSYKPWYSTAPLTPGILAAAVPLRQQRDTRTAERRRVFFQWAVSPEASGHEFREEKSRATVHSVHIGRDGLLATTAMMTITMVLLRKARSINIGQLLRQ
jgi:hypothetical protein